MSVSPENISWSIAGNTTSEGSVLTGLNGSSTEVLTHAPGSGSPPMDAASDEALIGISLLFCIIGSIGLAGNLLVIYIILSDKKMRRSVTNLFIMNLALADFLIMLLGIPEIVQFMLNRGWLLGLALCKLQRYVLVFSLYVSVMTLTSVCVERYIAIVHPIKAHILCSRRRILVAIGIIWPLSLLIALPTALFNQVRSPSPAFPLELCMIVFPGDRQAHDTSFTAFKVMEFLVFFLLPVLLQVVLYTIVGKRLFVGTESLHRKQTVMEEDGAQKQKDSDAIKARKGVVKMLIASVTVYFLSYAPAQVPFVYNLVSPTPFKHNWSFLVLIMTLAYINSAANPILYGIFSQNFRRRFAHVLCCCLGDDQGFKYHRTASTAIETHTFAGRGTVRFATGNATTATTVSEM